MSSTKPISTAAMLSELNITFPALWKRPLRDFGQAYADAEGVWTGQDTAHVMPDGFPIFDDLADGGDDAPEYDGSVHAGFVAWLSARGWYAERHDGTTYHLVPDAEVAE